MKKIPYKKSFEYLFPEIAKEWHPTKNEELKPSDITSGSNINIWWYLPYDDPETGKHFDFEWQETIYNRRRGYRCPFLTGKKVWKGFNDLESNYPELAKQFHSSKNGEMKPSDYVAHSSKYVWWYLPYDDPETGKHFDFEWRAKINDRTQGSGCPFLAGVAVWKGYNDLSSKYPDLVKEWHPYKNESLIPEEITWCSGKKIWWYLPYDDPKTGKHFDFEWKATIASRIAGNGCPFLSGRMVWPGYNDLASNMPELAKEWHPTKNGKLKPSDITSGSKKNIWWYLPYDDPETGKHFDFEWRAQICNRVIGDGCPFLTGHRVWPGYNDLESKCPGLAKEWHSEKNKGLNPSDVTVGSNKMVWWYLPYDDPETGKHFDFEWRAKIIDRTQGSGCPFLSGKKAWPGYNDLESCNSDLAKEWHPEKNKGLRPSDVTVGSNKRVWWCFPYDDPNTGKHFDFEWKASVKKRNQGSKCPFLSGKKAWPGYNDLESCNSDLAKEWHPTKNGKITPCMVTICSNKKRWWLCKNGHEWKASPVNRKKGRNCPDCSKG